MGKCRDFMHRLSLACQEKGYDREVFEIITIICCSSQMHESGFTSEEALQVAIDLVETKPIVDVYSEIAKMSGYKGASI